MSPVAPAQLGDEPELFQRHATRLRAIVTGSIGTSAANVEDACAFAWLQMLRHQPARQTLPAWLTRTAIREAIKLDRRQRRDGELVEEALPAEVIASSGSAPEDRIEFIAACEAVAGAGLREREADVLALHVSGYSYRETAQVRRMTTRTVERQLLRAKRKLRTSRRRQQLHAELLLPPARP